MSIGENDDGNEYTFAGLQLGYTVETPLGEGNYRIIGEWGSEEFLDPEGENLESRTIVLLSFDQQLGERLGAWIRFGWGDDKAAVDFSNLYSGGFDINGSLWEREQDNIGIGYAFLDGGNLEIDSSQVFEAYIRFGLNELFGLTLDAQYMTDDYLETNDDPKGWILGLRGVVEF